MERKGLMMEAEDDSNKQDIHILYEFTYLYIFILMHTFFFISIYLKFSKTIHICASVSYAHTKQLMLSILTFSTLFKIFR